MADPFTAAPATPADLPEICATRHRTTNRPVIIWRGQHGYYDAPVTLDPARFNAERGITEFQVQAMECGSMFGWDAPGARPETWAKQAAARHAAA